MGFKKGNKISVAHGMWGSRTYLTWAGMKARCNNYKNPKYPSYGGRGINLHPKWDRFEGFLDDMGIRPEGKTLDRVNNDMGYCKSNCKWSTPSEQNRNRRVHSNTGIKHITEFKGNYVVRVAPFQKTFRYFNLEDARAKVDDLRSLLKHISFKEGTMIVESINFKKLKPTQQYGNEEVSLWATLDEGDEVYNCIMELKKACTQALDTILIPTTTPDIKPKEVNTALKDEMVKEPAKKKVTKKTTKKVTKKSPPVEEEAKIVTMKEIKESLASVWKAKSKAVALEILAKFDCKRSDELSEDKFNEVIAECEKALK